jgi:hypothetical protein
LGILQFLQMTLETMKELFGITHVRDDEEVPNVKRMNVGEEVSLLQPIIVAVPLEEENVQVSHGLRRLPPEEEDLPVPLERPPITVPQEEEVPQGLLSQSHQRKMKSQPSLS